MTDAAQTDVRDLAGGMRWLIAIALDAGIDRELLDAVAHDLVGLLVELDAYRCGDHDPRRLRTLSLAQRVARAHDAGCSIAELRQRFGKSRSQIHRLLSHDKTRQFRGQIASVPKLVNTDARPAQPIRHQPRKVRPQSR